MTVGIRPWREEVIHCTRMVTEHQWKLKESAAISVAEFYTIGVDNMVRNLEAGRRKNFPRQLD